MKAYTDINQSKKLAEILPIESADMEYMFLKKDGSKVSNVPFVKELDEEPDCCYNFVPCWSLAALQDIIKINYKLEKTFLDQSDYCTYSLYDSDEPTFRTFERDNPIDACYEMILKLHEQKLL